MNKKSRRRNLKASSENISSKNNTNTISDTADRTGAMKASSTHELIKDLPELDDTSKINKDDLETHEHNNIENKEVSVALHKAQNDIIFVLRCFLKYICMIIYYMHFRVLKKLKKNLPKKKNLMKTNLSLLIMKKIKKMNLK